jgi:hypothetical protein
VCLSFVCAVLVALRPLNFLSDDALFYLVIAEHMAQGQGSTFNGLFETNGYHPLWQLIAALLAYVARSRHALLTLGVLVQCALNVFAFLILQRSLPANFKPAARQVFAAVMLCLFVPFGNLYWTEAPLNLFFVACTFALIRRDGPTPYLALGFLLSCTFLARLDNVFFIAAVFAGLVLRDRDIRIALAMLICGAVAITYLAVNLICFDHLIPISGAIKSAFNRGVYFHGQLGPYGLLSLISALGLAALNLTDRSMPPRYRQACLILACGVLMQVLYVWSLTYGDTTWVWYYVHGFVCAALCAGQLLCRVRWGETRALSAGLLGASVFVAVAIAVAKFLINWSWHDPRAVAGHWKQAWIEDVENVSLDSRSVLIVLDQPGLFAFSLSHPVFALDGLTTNYSLNAQLAREGMYAQLQAFGTSYLVAPIVDRDQRFRSTVISEQGREDGQIVEFFAPLSGMSAGCVWVSNSGLLTARPVPPTMLGGRWGVWRLDAATTRPLACEGT